MNTETYASYVKKMLDYAAYGLITKADLYRGLRRARKSLEKSHG